MVKLDRSDPPRSNEVAYIGPDGPLVDRSQTATTSSRRSLKDAGTSGRSTAYGDSRAGCVAPTTHSRVELVRSSSV